jgi:aminoglycoside phosphotransferase
MLPRRRVIRFRNGIADNLPAKKITGLAECGCAGIAKEHQTLRLQHNNVIFFVASDRYLSPRRANKSLERLSARPCGKLRAIQV